MENIVAPEVLYLPPGTDQACDLKIGRVYSHTRNVVWMEATGHFWAIVTPTLRDHPSNCFFSSYTIIAIY